MTPPVVSGVPAGFTVGVATGAILVTVSDGVAAVRTGEDPSGAWLWNRQVVGDGRLGAVLLDTTGATAAPVPEGFQRVHRCAEAVAELLGSGAIDVAVVPTAPGPVDPGALADAVPAAYAALGQAPAGPATRVDGRGWSLAALPGQVLLTDAVLTPEQASAVLAGLGTDALLVASGASGVTPDTGELTALLPYLLDHPTTSAASA